MQSSDAHPWATRTGSPSALNLEREPVFAGPHLQTVKSVRTECQYRIMYERVLIAVDASDEAKHAARRGLELAAGFDAAVDVLHVVPKSALSLTQTADERAELRGRGETLLDEIEALAADAGQSVTTTLLDGKPAPAICEYVAERDADLVVLGRQGMTGLGKRLLGGVTERVLHQSPAPVLVVPGEAELTGDDTAFSRILVPTDGSENAERATPHAIALAETHDATIHALHVVDLQAAGGVFDVGGLEPEFVERLEARGRAAVSSVAGDVDESSAGVDVETAVERATSYDGTAAGIRSYVDSEDVDLVVMGSHGRSNLQRQLLGSVASTVLRTVDVPVLVVTRAQ
jgi:nucleotide-binding universal stress UspA family protein